MVQNRKDRKKLIKICVNKNNVVNVFFFLIDIVKISILNFVTSFERPVVLMLYWNQHVKTIFINVFCYSKKFILPKSKDINIHSKKWKKKIEFLFTFKVKINFVQIARNILFYIAQLAGAVEYTDCISAEG